MKQPSMKQGSGRTASAMTLAGFIAISMAVQAQQPTLTRGEQAVTARSMEQPQPSAYPVTMPADVKLEVLPVLGNVFLLAGAASNVVVQTGEEGVFVVDTATADRGAEIVKAIRVLSTRPISYIVNTTFDPAHFGGNAEVGKAGVNPTSAVPTITGPGGRLPQGGGGNVQPQRQEGAVIFSHENLLNHMTAPTGEKSAVAFELWPTNTFFTARKTLSFNDEAIEMRHTPAANTDGDLMVFFRHSDVIAAGDIINTHGYSAFNPQRGGSIAGVLSALNDIIDIAVPRYNQQGGTRIVPGHGRVLNEADLVEYRDMTTIIHDRVKLGIEKNMTLAQIKAQKPTLEYDGLYSSPGLTGDMYIEAIYNDLMKASKPAGARPANR